MAYNMNRWRELLPDGWRPSWLPQMPFTDYHQLNLDWIIETVKEWTERLIAFFDEDGAKELVEDVLEEHPEWVTTVMDGSITKPKINAAFLQEIENGYITPEMFGAAGDGVEDDTQSLQNAIDAAYQNKRALVLTGKYKITSGLNVYGIPSAMQGSGSMLIGLSDARIVAAEMMSAIVTIVPGVAGETRAYDVHMKGITLAGNDNVSIAGINADCAITESTFEDLTIYECANGMRFNGNFYLNTLKNIRIQDVGIGIYLLGGTNTSLVFEKCYVNVARIAYQVNGQYCSMISCCADSISEIPFNLSSFRGVLAGCGSEANEFTHMFVIGRYSNVVIFGGNYFANPDLAGAYIDVALGSHLTLEGVTLNYTTETNTTGNLLTAATSAYVTISNCQIYAPFTGSDSIHSNAIVDWDGNNIINELLSLTVDTDGDAATELSAANNTILSAASQRTGWLVIPYVASDGLWHVKVCTKANFTPNISDPTYPIRVRYKKNNII